MPLMRMLEQQKRLRRHSSRRQASFLPIVTVFSFLLFSRGCGALSSTTMMAATSSSPRCRHSVTTAAQRKISMSSFVSRSRHIYHLSSRSSSRSRRLQPRRRTSAAAFFSTRRTPMTMMPEGPEVRTLVDQLQGGVGRKLIGITFQSGRYHESRNGPPDGYRAFAKSLTPVNSTATTRSGDDAAAAASLPISNITDDVALSTDIITSWNCKGKFIYIVLDDDEDSRHRSHRNNDPDYQRSIWITLGMTGKFLSEEANRQAGPRGHGRWRIELLGVCGGGGLGQLTNIYYHDARNFGTLRFCFSRQVLAEKLRSLGPDILAVAVAGDCTANETAYTSTFTADDFWNVVQAQRQTLNICKFLMDQSKISGIGNYLLAEGLYRAKVDPFASLAEIDRDAALNLFRELKSASLESYRSQGMTRASGGQYRTVSGERGKFVHELRCYGRETCADHGDPVRKEVNGPHGRTIWYTDRQLFMPRSERRRLAQQQSSSSKRAASPAGASSSPRTGSGASLFPSVKIAAERQLQSTSSSNPSVSATSHADPSEAMQRLLSGLTDPTWKEQLADATVQSESFRNLAVFLDAERASGQTIYPPESEIFNALNLCPFEDVKVVIVGQDPYHGPGQGHGLAFSVKRGVKPPPSLRNVFREAIEDVGIEEPTHGNLERWAKQGVLMLNAVLTVRQGEANSHSKRGWEDFTDAVVEHLNREKQGLVFLLWGNPAAKKGQNVDVERHTVIRTSHPSPLGATKTASPFLGSRCFSRANSALMKAGQDPIDWNVDD